MYLANFDGLPLQGPISLTSPIFNKIVIKFIVDYVAVANTGINNAVHLLTQELLQLFTLYKCKLNNKYKFNLNLCPYRPTFQSVLHGYLSSICSKMLAFSSRYKICMVHPCLNRKLWNCATFTKSLP